MKITGMKTAEIRKELVDLFTKIINDMTDGEFNKISKNVTNEGIANIAGKSRKEQVQMFTNKMNTLNREELVKKRHKLFEYKEEV